MSVTLLRSYSIAQGLRKRSSAIGGFDVDALAFIDVAAITDATQQTAVNDLVKGLKQNSLWDKLKTCYPFIGGTAAAHKWNLKDLRDVDAAYRLTFFGSGTHSANGWAGDGTTGYIDTNFTATDYAGLDNKMFCAYINTNVNGGLDFGSVDGSYRGESLTGRISGIAGAHVSNQEATTVASSDSRGFWIAARISSTSAHFRKNKTNLVDLSASTAQATGTQVIAARRDNGTVANFSSKRFGFFAMGDGLSKTECDTLYDIVHACQVTLGRSV